MTPCRLVALCVLVVTAGCTVPLVPSGTPSSPASDLDGPTPAATTTAPPVPTTPSTTPLPRSARNPWRSTGVVVAVDGSVNPNRSFTGLVEQAVAYWNGPGRPNATYPATFRVDPDASDPDVVVVVSQRVDCDDEEDALGCAPRLSGTDRPPRPVTVEVAAGFADEATVRTLIHEFGHVLGIGHGEPPLPLMEPRYAAATLPATDAVNKSNPWATETLHVFADYTNATADVATLRYQLDRAVGYYDAGAEGHAPSNVSLELVENRSRAHVVVVFNQGHDQCSTDAARSCGSWQGIDPDQDGALEYFTGGTIVLNGIDADAAGWHVGYWLGVLLGHDREEERAPPFRDASYADRRSAWWE